MRFFYKERCKMKTRVSERTQNLVLAGLLAAFTAIATLLIQIPTPTKGYVNLGDCFVNISGWILGPVYGGAAAGVGSALADMISGYTVYAPATLVIKAGMAAASAVIYTKLSRRFSGFAARIAAAVTAELIMSFGYMAFESVLYGSAAAALPGIPANLAQGILGAVISVTLFEAVLKRIPFLKEK